MDAIFELFQGWELSKHILKIVRGDSLTGEPAYLIKALQEMGLWKDMKNLRKTISLACCLTSN